MFITYNYLNINFQLNNGTCKDSVIRNIFFVKHINVAVKILQFENI